MQCNSRHRGRTITIFMILLLIVSISGLGCTSSVEPPADALIIEGKAVKGQTFFTLDKLKSMQDGLVEADYCSVNTYGTREYTHFKGIWVGHILNELNLKANAEQVTFIAEDGYTAEYSIENAIRDDYIDDQNPETKYKMILAWEVNGRELDPRMGMPLQLVVGQRHPGEANKPYWVRTVKTIRID